MSKITQLDLWDDTGFTEGCVEVPSVSNVLPAPSHSYTTQLTPDVNRMFSELKVPVAYTDIMNSSYLKITLTLNNNTTKIFYGWIDSVSIISDTSGYSSSLITWHTDLWRTYLAQATFGYGNVIKRPQSSSDPIQNVNVRIRTAGLLEEMGTSYTNALWGFFNYTYEDSNHHTRHRTAVIPLRRDNFSDYIYWKIPNGNTYRTLTIQEVLEGRVEELLGIDPDAISSFYISPIPPFQIQGGNGSSGSPYVFQGTSTQRVPTEYNMGYDPYIVDSTIYYYMGVPSAYRFVWRDRNGENERSRTIDSGPNVNFNNLKPLGKSKEDAVKFKFAIGEDTLTEVDNIYVKDIDDFVNDNIPSPTYDAMSDGDYVVLSQSFYVVDNNNFTSTGLVTRISNAQTTNTLYKNNGNFGSGKKVVLLHDPATVTMTAYVTPAGSGSAYTAEQMKDDRYAIFSNSANYYEHSGTLATPHTTDEITEWVFTDFDGVRMGTLPWGRTVQSYGVRDIVTSTGGYIEYRFWGQTSHLDGVSFIVPLPAIDICSNSWSSYVYSGQREYDIQQRQIAREQALVGSITNSVTSTAQMTSALSNGAKGMNSIYEDAGRTAGAGALGLGALGGAVGGAVVGAGIGAVTGAIDYAISGHFNGKLQSATDTLMANQTDSILLYGRGWDWIYHGKMPGLYPMKADQYSEDVFTATKTLHGITCNEPTSNCTILINAGGPLQIQNLSVNGNIPIEAKRYIRNRLSQGVRII